MKVSAENLQYIIRGKIEKKQDAPWQDLMRWAAEQMDRHHVKPEVADNIIHFAVNASAILNEADVDQTVDEWKTPLTQLDFLKETSDALEHMRQKGQQDPGYDVFKFCLRLAHDELEREKIPDAFIKHELRKAIQSLRLLRESTLRTWY